MSCQDSIAEVALHDIAELLATAYDRFSKVRRMPESVQSPVNKELDNGGDLSPHEL